MLGFGFYKLDVGCENLYHRHRVRVSVLHPYRASEFTPVWESGLEGLLEVPFFSRLSFVGFRASAFKVYIVCLARFEISPREIISLRFKGSWSLLEGPWD